MSLPEYTIKTSTRARHVRFKITPAEGLCVVLPRGFDLAGVPQLVANKKAWIEKALKDVAARATPTPADFLPGKLALPAIDEIWTISYQGGGKRASLVADSVKRQLVFSAPEHVQDTVFNVLRSWLRLRARNVLVDQAYTLSRDFDFNLSNVTIRNQRARWGSCSSKKALSLNLKLLFLEAEQVRHVLLHELCHTVHLNHSAKFWQLVARFEPGYKVINKSMKNAWQAVPRWV